MKPKAEIYRIIFNKLLRDGRVIFDEYFLDMESQLPGKVPESIVLKEDKVTVTFTDKSRHIFPYNDSVEYFDRLIEKKDGQTEDKPK